MAFAWFVCPYDKITDAPTPFPARRCAMHRYIPIPNWVNGLWDEAEILGNHCVVKVSASDSMIATIEADPDFIRIPTDKTTIEDMKQLKIFNKLYDLTYTLQEIADCNWVFTQLLALLTTAKSEVNAVGGDFVVTKDKRLVAKKTVADIEKELPG